jgi:hypothetical protein
MRGANDHRVAGDYGRGMETDFSCFKIDLLVVIELQSTTPLRPKSGTGAPFFALSAIETIARSDVKNSLFASIGPIRQSAPRQRARGIRRTGAFIFCMRPQDIARSGIQCDHSARRSPVE